MENGKVTIGKMKKIKLYLSHPILMRTEVRQWELYIEGKYNINLLNPFYEKSQLETKIIRTLDKEGEFNYSKKISDEIVMKDEHLIKNADGLLSMMGDALAIGTPMELYFSYRVCHKPTFVIAPNAVITKDGKWSPVGNHPWVQAHTDKWFSNKELFEKFISSGGLSRAIHKKGK